LDLPRTAFLSDDPRTGISFAQLLSLRAKERAKLGGFAIGGEDFSLGSFNADEADIRSIVVVDIRLIVDLWFPRCPSFVV